MMLSCLKCRTVYDPFAKLQRNFFTPQSFLQVPKEGVEYHWRKIW